MAAEFLLGKISAIQYGAGTADIAIPERSNVVMPSVPFLSTFYDMPKVGDMVACIFSEDNGRLGRGCVLGRLFSSVNPPQESGADKFFMKLPDGTIIRCSGSEMEITAAKVKVKELNAKKVVSEEIVTKAGVNLDTHTHPYSWTDPGGSANTSPPNV